MVTTMISYHTTCWLSTYLGRCDLADFRFWFQIFFGQVWSQGYCTICMMSFHTLWVSGGLHNFKPPIRLTINTDEAGWGFNMMTQHLSMCKLVSSLQLPPLLNYECLTKCGNLPKAIGHSPHIPRALMCEKKGLVFWATREARFLSDLRAWFRSEGP